MNEAVPVRGIKILPQGLKGALAAPDAGMLFAHASGSSNGCPCEAPAPARKAGLATLLFDPLPRRAARQRRKMFDGALLDDHLEEVPGCAEEGGTADLEIGSLGAGTEKAAALSAAALRPQPISAIVSHGRPSRAADAPAFTLPIVGMVGAAVAPKGRATRLARRARLPIVRGAGALEEPGARDCLANSARPWFVRLPDGSAPS
jgi:hypothetical protein